MYYSIIILIVTCLISIGVNRVALVQFCKCFTESQSLISLGYFPATPKKTNLAIDIQLFDLLEALLLECHVSVFDFVLALHSMSDVLYNYQVHYYWGEPERAPLRRDS